jgi:hypothetical protein
MTTKIKTPFGFRYLPDTSTIDNDTASYNKTNSQKNIDIIEIISDDVKKAYRTANPYGIGYTNHYSRVLSSKNEIMKLTGGKPNREIDFLEIS